MMGESMGVCPIQLLFKDYKKWEQGHGTAPPTRQVAGGTWVWGYICQKLYLTWLNLWWDLWLEEGK